ncbi:SDR family NAD(P)-dependent oxidoreductase [Mycolicibacterium arabiense]|uniref:SDR family NAD(P)-dependent oxidoreductase n=1 Tax=Mycolicibacterium arabiense TaxID=1286181 RepID=UPI0013D2EA0D|nr:SDR family NAD(P)-dependent oxidoreductase [Mycolicibacterium arabiense]MCV7372187.1 SDR family NAD(P)-dependent oxidoreductase [Mycolicibacterium arabiense]
MTNGKRGRVVITGASTRIGEATALHLHDLGFAVFAGVRREEDAERLRGRGLTTMRLDVTDPEQIEAASVQVGDQPLVGLVNNAGITRSRPLEYVSAQDVRQQLDVNVVGQIGGDAGVHWRIASGPWSHRQRRLDLGVTRHTDDRPLRDVEIRIGGDERRPAA